MPQFLGFGVLGIIPPNQLIPGKMNRREAKHLAGPHIPMGPGSCLWAPAADFSHPSLTEVQFPRTSAQPAPVILPGGQAGRGKDNRLSPGSPSEVSSLLPNYEAFGGKQGVISQPPVPCTPKSPLWLRPNPDNHGKSFPPAEAFQTTVTVRARQEIGYCQEPLDLWGLLSL